MKRATVLIIPLTVLVAFCGRVNGLQQTPGAPASFGRPASDIGQIALGSLLPAAVPYTVSSGLIVVKASIAESIPQDAAIATSLPMCVAAPVIVSNQSLRTEGVRDLQTIAEIVKTAGLPPQALHVGRLVLASVPFTTFDLVGHLSKRGLQTNPTLWLGASALAAVVTTIDPGQKLVVFSPPSTALANSAVKVPFEIRDGRMYVKVQFGDKKQIDCLVDTTSTGTLIPSDLGKSLGLTPLVTFSTSNKEGKPIKVVAVEVPQLTLGMLKVNDVQTIYVSEGDDSRAEPAVGILGTDVLLRYKLTIHYGLRMLAFEPIKPGATFTAPQQSPTGTLPRAPIGRPIGKKTPG